MKPTSNVASNPIDVELFSIYFLITETVATVLWVAIAAHCLRGARVPWLSPPLRCLIATLYASAKLALLRYAFASTFYFKATQLVTGVCGLLAAVAWVWRRGPFWFLFQAKPLRVFESYSSIASFLRHIAYVVLQGLVAVPTPADTAPAQQPASVQHQLSKLHFHVNRDIWNGAMIEHWRLALLGHGRARRVTRDDLPYYETRVLFAMQSDGLLVSFYLLPPLPSILLDLHTACRCNVYELVLRYLKCSADVAVEAPLMYYATNPISSAVTSSAQRDAIQDLLRRLNVNLAVGRDIPLRLLKTHNFIAAGTPGATKRVRRPSSTSKFQFD
ncbi:hypothetical protein SPRG_20755 [Saprolegnia parasitica CBS 223.65]|uniref:Uncharacterized protein n=1 Tax=Saprolegnia parasitica (strain CBS 223.65) TaxID=695850 RepID=A0A067C4H6_SAPPC|nr:hypothetical protein SPRG_20755 [Saprolegnia parasitica CBS 223.65]KDO25433.1 hypothetical protein SPRG_20755 [Saprolegnia parasitica CBS 223.65]|eukprot:XP_012203920.1 hypothetical protein SPRG_20755 [Saprolegnia parasitica CBS 223.65]